MGLKKSLLNTAFAYTVQSFDIFNNWIHTTYLLLQINPLEW